MAVPEWLTLITYQFLHGGPMHLLSNMLFLWVFGDNVEDALGHPMFLVFYLLCGVAGGLAHAAVRCRARTCPWSGASGAICGRHRGVSDAAPARARLGSGVSLPAAAVAGGLVLGFWVVTQLAMVVLAPPSDGVAWWAHMGGMVAGAVLVLFMRRPGVPLFDRGLVAPAIERRS